DACPGPRARDAPNHRQRRRADAREDGPDPERPRGQDGGAPRAPGDPPLRRDPRRRERDRLLPQPRERLRHRAGRLPRGGRVILDVLRGVFEESRDRPFLIDRRGATTYGEWLAAVDAAASRASGVPEGEVEVWRAVADADSIATLFALLSRRAVVGL